MFDGAPLLHHKFHDCGGGKQMRYAILEPPQPRGTILVAPGRREFIEKKHFELTSDFLRLGFRLIYFEWRGQGLSDRFLAGAKRQRDYVADFSVYLDDISSLYAAVVQPFQTGPLLLYGHSMGAHLLLRWLVERQPQDIAGLILTAPMLALSSMPAHTVARSMTWTSVRLGHGSDYAPGQHDYAPADRTFTNNPLTQDEQRFTFMDKYFAVHPDMIVGGVTWGWLDAALKSMHYMHHRAYFERLATPVTVITGGHDRVTPPNELSRIIKRIRGAENHIVPGALHDVMNELEPYRFQAWQYINAFVSKLMAA